jgi:hypothetical protein
MKKIVFVTIAWAVLVPLGTEAQTLKTTRATTSITDAVNLVREGRVSSPADFLTNKRGGVTGEERSAFADSLVAIATSYRSGDPRGALSAAIAAMTVVEVSADSSRATPFPHAFETFVRIYEGSPEERIRSTVLTVIGSLPEKGRAVEFLSAIAVESDGRMPLFAVRALAEQTGQPGLNALRRLYNEKTVLHPGAKELLSSVARRNGWGMK